MIGGLRPYPEMTPTGLPWLGDVPAHWEVRQLKHVTTPIEQGWSPQCDAQRANELEWGVLKVGCVNGERFAQHQNKRLPETLSPRMDLEIRDGDILVSRANTRELVGLSAVAYHPRPKLLLCDKLFRFRAIEGRSNPNFLTYAIRLRSSRAQIESQTHGASDSMQNIGRRVVRNLYFALPPLEEQRLIVRFLDWHGGQTAKLIRTKKKLIALLNEQKQAIIHRAVTRGLDPNVKLKPSGIPWLGDVPEGWKVKRLRNVAELRVSNIDKKSFEDELPVRLCNYVDVYKNDAIHADIPFMEATASKAEIERFRLRIGDVIITKDSEDWKDIGVPAFVGIEADDLVCAYHLALLRPNGTLTDGAFLFWQLLSPDVRQQFAIAANGVTRYGLSRGSIKELVLSVPDIVEQRAIAAHLDAATASIRFAERDIHREIALLQEFRTRLIADVVTGKLDLRAAAASLPEITELKPIDESTDGDDPDETIDDAENEEVAA